MLKNQARATSTPRLESEQKPTSKKNGPKAPCGVILGRVRRMTSQAVFPDLATTETTCRQMRITTLKVSSEMVTAFPAWDQGTLPSGALRRVDLPTNIGHLDRPMQSQTHSHTERQYTHMDLKGGRQCAVSRMEHPKPSRSMFSCMYASCSIIPSTDLPRHRRYPQQSRAGTNDFPAPPVAASTSFHALRKSKPKEASIIPASKLKSKHASRADTARRR